MGFELEKRLASELNRYADEAQQDRDVQRPSNKHVERLKKIAAELQAKLRGDHDRSDEAPGKRNGVEDALASAVRRMEELGKRSRFDQLPWQQNQRATFDDYRATGLREVLDRLSDRKLRGATLASAEPGISARTGQTTKTAASPAGQAMWRAAERRAATLYRHAMDGGEVAGEDPIVDEALERCGGGHALPLAVRKQMEAELGISLARVRVHTDSVAAGAAKAVRAEAFTVGEDIFFAEGLYAPTSREGQKLLAHELTHVVQSYQGRTATGGAGIQVSQPGESLEREADAVADRVVERVARPRSNKQQQLTATQAPRARGSSPALPAAAPAIGSVSAARGALLQRKPATENSSANDAEGPKKKSDDPNKRGKQPNLVIERDHAGERTKRDAKKGADPMKDGGQLISANVKKAVSGAVNELKSTSKSVKEAGVGKNAKQLGKQQGKQQGQHAKEAQKIIKAAKDAEKTTAKPVKSSGPKNGKDHGGGGNSGPVKFKPISNWDKYMPAELPDQDPKERKRILGLVKDQVNGDRQQSGSMLNQLRKAQLDEAKQVRGMLPGLQSSIKSGQASAVGKVNGAEAAQCGAVRAAVAAVTAQVRATGARMIGQINQAHTAAVAAINEAKQSAIQKLTEAKTTALSDIDQAETSQITIVNAAFLATKTAIIAAGADKASEASGRGDSYPLSYDGDKLEAARKAAKEVAAEYAKAMPGEATKAYAQIDGERPKTISDIQKMATDQRKQVNDAFTQCKQTVTDAATQAVTGAGEIQSGAVAQVSSTMSTTTSQLAAHGASSQAAIRTQASGARSGIQKAGAAALKSVADGVNKAAAGLQKGATGLIKGAHQVEAPNVGETKQRVTEGMQQLGESSQQIAAGMKKSVTGTVAGLTQQATGAVTGMGQTASGAKSAAQQMGQGANQAMTQIGQSSSTGLQQLGENLKKSADDIAGKGKEAMKGVVTGLREAFATATTSLNTGLEGAVTNVKTSFAEAVLPAEDAAIAENAKKAADAVKPWWQKALAFVVSIVVAIVVVVVITALIVTTGPVGAILVGAAAGALGSVLGQMASNLVLGNGLMDGVTWQTVAMGAVGGAVGAGFTSAISAGASRFGATAVTSAMKGGTGVGAFAIRTGVGVSGDLVSDAATQLIFTGGYEFSMENLATSLVTNAISSTNKYDSAQDGFQSSIRNRAGHIEIGRPGGGGLNLSTSAHAPGAPVTNSGGGGAGGAHVDPPANGPAPRPAGGGTNDGGSNTGGGPGNAPRPDTTTTRAATPDANAPRPATPDGNAPRPNAPDGSAPRPNAPDANAPRPNAPDGQRAPDTRADATQDQGGQVTRRNTGGGDDATAPKPKGDGQNARGDNDGNARTDGDGKAHDGPRPDAPAGKKANDGADHHDDGPGQQHHDDGGDSDGAAPHGDGSDATPDGPESAAAGALDDLGYPNPTRRNADRAAAAIEEGSMPPRDTVRDTEANTRGLQELRTIDADSTLSPESKTNIRREVANGLRADEPTGNLSRDVQQARAHEDARVASVKAEQAKVEAAKPADGQTPDGQTPGGKAPDGQTPATPARGAEPAAAPAATPHLARPLHSGGLAEPAIRSDFASRLQDTQKNWGRMSPQERQASLRQALNEQMKAAGMPEVKLVVDDLGGRNGELRFQDFAVAVDRALVERPNMTKEQMQSVADTLLHEARHGEQWYMMGRHMSTMVDPATGRPYTPEAAAARMQMPVDVVRTAFGDTRPMAPDARAAARGYYESVYGNFAGHRNAVIDRLDTTRDTLQNAADRVNANAADSTTPHDQVGRDWADYQQALADREAAYSDYRRLPEEVDAWGVGSDAGDTFRYQAQNRVKQLWDRLMGNRPDTRGSLVSDSPRPTRQPGEPARPPEAGNTEPGVAPRAPANDQGVTPRAPGADGDSVDGTRAGGSKTPQDVLRMNHKDFATDVDAQRTLFEAAGGAVERMKAIGAEVISGLHNAESSSLRKRDTFEAFVEEVGKKQRLKSYNEMGEMTDIIRGRFNVENAQDMQVVADRMQERFAGNIVELKRPRPGYPRWHINVRDASTGLVHEWQVGTEATTQYFEKLSLKIPDTVTKFAPASPNFHDGVYKLLDRVKDPAVRQQHGLDEIKADYTVLAEETGNGTPANYQARYDAMAARINQVLHRIEATTPGYLDGVLAGAAGGH